MPIIGLMGIILFLAFLVEALVEYVLGTLFSKIELIKPYAWCLMYVSVAVGVAGAFIYKLDMVSILAVYLNVEIPVNAFGIAITGISIGRGANFIHDIWQKFFVKA
jgi:hypothetical protein